MKSDNTTQKTSTDVRCSRNANEHFSISTANINYSQNIYSHSSPNRQYFAQMVLAAVVLSHTTEPYPCRFFRHENGQTVSILVTLSGNVVLNNLQRNCTPYVSSIQTDIIAKFPSNSRHLFATTGTAKNGKCILHQIQLPSELLRRKDQLCQTHCQVNFRSFNFTHWHGRRVAYEILIIFSHPFLSLNWARHAFL